MNSLDVSDLVIVPESNPGSPIVARCTATFNSALVIDHILIIQGKKNIFVRFPKVVKPALAKSKKSIESRILATFIINHCVEDYNVNAA